RIQNTCEIFQLVLVVRDVTANREFSIVAVDEGISEGEFPSLIFNGGIQVVKDLNSHCGLSSETPQQQVGSFLEIVVNATRQAFVEKSKVKTHAGLSSRFPFQSGVHRSLCGCTRNTNLTVGSYAHVRITLSTDIFSVTKSVLITNDTVTGTQFKGTKRGGQKSFFMNLPGHSS